MHEHDSARRTQGQGWQQKQGLLTCSPQLSRHRQELLVVLLEQRKLVCGLEMEQAAQLCQRTVDC
jgi:hypothetical protein